MAIKYDLSILIPARNEMFLVNTIENILSNIEGNTEIICVLDGAWANPPIKDNPRVTLVYHSESIGQRAATNEACKLSNAKYVMKCDAHCSFDKGFDVKLMADMQDDWTVVPVMKNLHAFDWVCKACGERRYQGPSGKCKKCGGEEYRDILWKAKDSPNSTSYCFDPEPHFQYFNEFKKRPEGQGDLTETMSLQGSCFMMTREKYWELNICDENFGSWGSQGIEVAIKTWLSGGRVICNHKTWYAHMFRTQGGDFGFPYQLSGNQIQHAKKTAKELFFNGKWDKQKYPLSWLIKKFYPVYKWTDEDLKRLEEAEKNGGYEYKQVSKEIIYFTDNKLKVKIADKCRRNLSKMGLPIISVSLKPMSFGRNIYMDLKRGYLTMFKQILTGLEASRADVVFLCEHDVLYDKSHFDFVPKKDDVFYYNVNVWKVRYEDGFGVKVDDCKQVSGLCANRKLLINHYRKLIVKILRNQADLIEQGLPVKNDGFSLDMSFEPGTHEGTRESWQSKYPNLDIRHENNLTKNRWKKEEFRNEKYTIGWTESYDCELGKFIELIK